MSAAKTASTARLRDFVLALNLVVHATEVVARAGVDTNFGSVL